MQKRRIGKTLLHITIVLFVVTVMVSSTIVSAAEIPSASPSSESSCEDGRKAAALSQFSLSRRSHWTWFMLADYHSWLRPECWEIASDSNESWWQYCSEWMNRGFIVMIYDRSGNWIAPQDLERINVGSGYYGCMLDYDTDECIGLIEFVDYVPMLSSERNSAGYQLYPYSGPDNVTPGETVQYWFPRVGKGTQMLFGWDGLELLSSDPSLDADNGILMMEGFGSSGISLTFRVTASAGETAQIFLRSMRATDGTIDYVLVNRRLDIRVVSATPAAAPPASVPPTPIPTPTPAAVPSASVSATPVPTPTPAAVPPTSQPTAEPTPKPSAAAVPAPSTSSSPTLNFGTLGAFEGNSVLQTEGDMIYGPALTVLEQVDAGHFAAMLGIADSVLSRGEIVLLTGDVLRTGDTVIWTDKNVIPIEYTVVIKGDVAGTGKAGVSDLVMMARMLSGSGNYDARQLLAADWNNSGAIELSDLVQQAAVLRSKGTESGAVR